MKPNSETNLSKDPSGEFASQGSHSRRKFVGGFTTGIVAAMAAPSLGNSPASSTSDTKESHELPGQSVKQNPLDQYPKPPFPMQKQEWPGLASEMKPRPDHGEKSYQGSGRLSGRKALVTGGDSGIGRAAAIAFAREGADVAINYLPAEESDAAEVVELIKAAGRKAVAIPGDIQNEAFCKKLIETVVNELGGLDILVNNAGRQQATKSILDLTTESFDATFRTNIYATFWITKAAVPHLKPGASIINTGSVVAEEPPSHLLDYSATKAAIINFSMCLSKQLAEKGIRVNAVAPGPVWTPLQISGGQLEETLAEFGMNTALKRAGQPAELAPVFVFLASQESSFVTGLVYSATGGKGVA